MFDDTRNKYALVCFFISSICKPTEKKDEPKQRRENLNPAKEENKKTKKRGEGIKH